MSKIPAITGLYPVLSLVFLSMLCLMFAFEFGKQVLNPSMTLWESHTITIVFTSILAVVILYFPLRTSYLQQQKIEEVLALGEDAREKVRKSEMQYRSFMESAEDSIYAVDPDCRYLLINTRHLERMGLSAQAYAGRSYAEFHSPEDTMVFEGQVKKIVETKKAVQDEYEQDGRYYVRKLNPVIDPRDNRVVAVTVISSDITVQKLDRKNLELINQKLNLMNDITRHDILNQLTALSSLLALAGGQSEEPVTKNYLLRSESAIGTIQSQILFARDYQNIGVESPKWQNIAETIRRVSPPPKPASVTIDGSCAGWEIYADPLLEKVFFNLMENSVRYSGPVPEIRFSAREEQGQLVLLCEDNGPGVPDENKEKIFLRGFGRNTGLGLFLIKGILGITGITIRENGTAGKGGRFEITVPPGAFRPVAAGS